MTEQKPLTERQRASRRVAVAKDVLKQIKARKYVATAGLYAIAAVPTDDIDVGSDFWSPEGYRPAPLTSMQKIAKKTRVCQVCALGGVFMSYAGLYNQIEVHPDRLASFGYDPDGRTAPRLKQGEAVVMVTEDGARGIAAAVGEVFSKEQLALIEYAFEGKYCGNQHDAMSDEDIGRAKKFAHRYKTSTGRLRAIMNNIITNKGEFVLAP